MAFTTGYFVITTKGSDFDSKKPLKLKPYKDCWIIMDGFIDVGDIFVFEREDACRRLYEFKKTRSRRYGSETSIRFIRSLTRKGAAKSGFVGEGEVLEYFRPTYEEAQEYAKQDRQEELDRVREDIAKFRFLLEQAHARFPKIDRKQIPASNSENPQTELIYLNRYVCGLARCGAIAYQELEEFKKSLTTGFSYNSDLDEEIEMVPND